ncbi:MAG TPA: cysteine dioxygenase family protein [Blastocatellia bacterium]|jgi:cysteine dioxygenase|nr:cysteine dioxygenase family protein [Blastocatellia bacterium]
MRVTDTNVVYEPRTATATGELSLDEVARIITNLKEVPTLGEIKEWFSALLMRQRDYESYRVFTKRKYARNLIARGPFAELLMLCWHSGQRTPIHDHGGSVGVILLAEGSLTETMYERMPEGHVRPYNTYKWSPGAITGADVPDIHQLLNLQPEGRDMVTLHCYAPPLSVLNTFSPRSSRVRRWREGYFTGGAGI